MRASLVRDDSDGARSRFPVRSTRQHALGSPFWSKCAVNCDEHQSPNEIPISLAVRTVSWSGSTRLGSPSASDSGMETMCGGWRAIMCPHRCSSTARTAAPPNRVASRRS